MVKLLVLLGLGYITYRWVRSTLLGGRPVDDPPPVTDDLVQDPQCRVYIARRDAVTSQMGDRTLYFCSEDCRHAYMTSQSQQAGADNGSYKPL